MAKHSQKSHGETTITPPRAEVATAAAGNLLKRSQAARMLGVSTTTLRRMEGTVLSPEVGPDGVHRFRESHIRELVMHRETAPAPERYDGVMAAHVFELLDQGVHPVDIVKRLALDPRSVQAIHEQWASMRAAFVVTGEIARKIESIPWILGMRPIRTGKDLWFNLQTVDPRVCARCKDAIATLCAQCVRAMKDVEVNERVAATRKRREELEGRQLAHLWERDFSSQLANWSKEPAVAVRPEAKAPTGTAESPGTKRSPTPPLDGAEIGAHGHAAERPGPGAPDPATPSR